MGLPTGVCFLSCLLHGSALASGLVLGGAKDLLLTFQAIVDTDPTQMRKKSSLRKASDSWEALGHVSTTKPPLSVESLHSGCNTCDWPKGM